MELIIADTPEDQWIISSNTRNFITPTVPLMYCALAIMIRIQGMGFKSIENDPVHCAQNIAINEALQYFKEIHNQHPLTRHKMETIIASVFIRHQNFSLLSRNFQNVFTDIGEIACADEKLCRFTGSSPWSRCIPAKPSKVGHWIYELVVTLSSGKPFLLYLRLRDSNKNQNTSIPVITIVKEWMNLVQSFGNTSILVFDSYYTDRASVDLLVKSSPPVKFIGTVNPTRFSSLVNIVKKNVTKAYEWCSIYNEKSELMLTMNRPDLNASSSKYVMTNVYSKRARNSNDSTSKEILGYDLFGETFNGCDKYNRSMHEKKWPYTSGGFKRSGTLGSIRDFACDEYSYKYF
jgi:Transposase IS4